MRIKAFLVVEMVQTVWGVSDPKILNRVLSLNLTRVQ